MLSPLPAYNMSSAWERLMSFIRFKNSFTALLTQHGGAERANRRQFKAFCHGCLVIFIDFPQTFCKPLPTNTTSHLLLSCKLYSEIKYLNHTKKSCSIEAMGCKLESGTPRVQWRSGVQWRRGPMILGGVKCPRCAKYLKVVLGVYHTGWKW